MPLRLSFLLKHARASLLVLLVVVLPLQSVAQLAAGLQGHRHLHAGVVRTASQHQAITLSTLTRPLRALLDRLHAAQDPRLRGSPPEWLASRGPASGLHEHGGVFHRHSAGAADVLEVGDATDESQQAGATALLAWLPALPALPARVAAGDHPRTAPLDWRDRLVAPPLAPPRG